MAKIILYQFEHCPFCAKVRVKLDELRLDYEKVNVSTNREDVLRKELLEKSGVATVPVLGMDGKFIGESDAIISYLDSSYSWCSTSNSQLFWFQLFFLEESTLPGIEKSKINNTKNK